MRFYSRFAALTGLITSLALGASAVPTTVTAVDTPPCDPLVVPTLVDELGTGAFPPGEQISSYTFTTNLVACTATENPVTTNVILGITNFNTISFTDLWYVADPETTLSNVDGTVNGMLAFKIDAVGVNTPLIPSVATADGIFAPGETWEFIIQDYANPFLPASALSSIGVPSVEPLPPFLSSGSIIARPIPEPGTAALIGLGLIALGMWRRVD